MNPVYVVMLVDLTVFLQTVPLLIFHLPPSHQMPLHPLSALQYNLQLPYHRIQYDLQSYAYNPSYKYGRRQE